MLRHTYPVLWRSLLAGLLLSTVLIGSYDVSYATSLKKTAAAPIAEGECFKWPTRLEILLGRYAAQTGVDPSLLLAVITQESRLDSLAVNPNAPSYGIGMVMPKWWRYKYVRQCGAEATPITLMRMDVGMCYTAHILSYFIGRYGTRRGVNAYNNGRGHDWGYADEVFEEMTQWTSY